VDDTDDDDSTESRIIMSMIKCNSAEAVGYNPVLTVLMHQLFGLMLRRSLRKIPKHL
jgi:hypothetical protein